jgi:hypothetical protein
MSSIQRTVAGQPSIANLPCEITRDDQRTAESFGANDIIDIKDCAARGTSLSYDTTSGLLQLTNGTKMADLEFQVGTFGSGTFHSATDGNAGTLITLR